MIELLPTQAKFMNIDHDIDIDISMYQGGMGSGKTFAGSLLGISLCIQYPGITGIVVANTFDQVDKATRAKWFELLAKSGLMKKRHWDYNETKHTLKFKNGSTVYFSHCSEPEKLRSLEAGFIEMEEASLMEESSFKEMLGRLRQTVTEQGTIIPRRRLFAHTNPEASKGWIYKHFVEKTKSTIEYTDETVEFTVKGRTGRTRYIRKITEELLELEDGPEKVKVAYRLVIAPTIQNFHNSLSYVAQMKSSFDPEFYKINVLGEFGDYTSGLVSKGFDRDKQLVPLMYNPKYPLHISCDFNWDPNCWFIVQVYDDCVYFLDEIVLEHTDTEQCIFEFMRRYPQSGYRDIIINGDASGGQKQAAAVRGDNYAIIINALSHGGYRVKRYAHIPSKNPDRIVRVNAWNSKMCNASGEHSLFFNATYDKDGDLQPATPRLIHCIENLKFAQGTNIIMEPSRAEMRKDINAKFDPHVFDGASYIVSYYFPLQIESNPAKDMGRPRLVDSRFNLVGDDY